MRLVAVTRIRNEDDIVEAFVRHHAAMVDHHVFLDNGSNDRTVEILKSLRTEGVGVSIFSNRSPVFVEVAQNTHLLRHALALGADWVLHLDCDVPSIAARTRSRMSRGARETSSATRIVRDSSAFVAYSSRNFRPRKRSG